MLANFKYEPYYPISNKQIYTNMSHNDVITYKEEPYFKHVLEIMKALPRKDTIHDTLHAFRTAIWSLVLYCQIAQETEETYEFIKYFLMGWFHDIGRTHDDTEPVHGAKSEEVLIKLEINKVLLKPFLEAIRMHSCKDNAQTLQEIVLFDADRFERVRLPSKKFPVAKFMSSAASNYFDSFVESANNFLINKFYSKMSVLCNHSKAINFIMFLYENLEFLQSKLIYHGSPFQNLTSIDPSVRYENNEANNGIEGAKLLFFTKDWYWVIHRTLTRSIEIYPEKDVHDFSVYSIKKEDSQNLICSDGRIEYVRTDSIEHFQELKFTLPSDTTYEQVVAIYNKSSLSTY